MKKPKKNAQDLQLEILCQSRGRLERPRSVVFRDKSKYNRNDFRAQTRRESRDW